MFIKSLDGILANDGALYIAEKLWPLYFIFTLLTSYQKSFVGCTLYFVITLPDSSPS